MVNDDRDRGTGDALRLPRMLSLAVHELRTPMTVLTGYVRMLLREQVGPLADKQRKVVEEVDKSSRRIAALIEELNELAKLESREAGMGRAEFDLAAAVTEAAGGMHDEERGVRVEVRGGERPLMVAGERPRIVAAVKALVHSAVRERGEAGVVVVECNIVDTWGVVAIGDEATLPALTRDAASPAGFDEWRGGMGLSLPLARRVLEAHGGAVWSATTGSSRAASALRLPLAPAFQAGI